MLLVDRQFDIVTLNAVENAPKLLAVLLERIAVVGASTICITCPLGNPEPT